jgi:hypothetical protein
VDTDCGRDGLLMSSVANQYNPNGVNPYANQCTFGQVLGRVNGYATHASPSVVANTINNVVRRIYDRRYWYGNFRSGYINVPGYYSTGSITMTQGSNIVNGVGTSWTPSMVGQQIRTGFVNPIYTIKGFNSATQLVLDPNTPWGPPTLTTSGYFITQYWYSFQNIKFFYSVTNLQLQFRMATNVPASLLENWDPPRLVQLFPYVVATRPPDQSGNYVVELWPVSNSAQSYPYLAYVQPPNLVNDLDPLPAFIRSDLVEMESISQILMYRPKANPNYSEGMCLQMSKELHGQFASELDSAMQMDEGLLRTDIINAAEVTPTVNIDMRTGRYLGVGGGSFLAAMTARSSDDYDY